MWRAVSLTCPDDRTFAVCGQLPSVIRPSRSDYCMSVGAPHPQLLLSARPTEPGWMRHGAAKRCVTAPAVDNTGKVASRLAANAGLAALESGGDCSVARPDCGEGEWVSGDVGVGVLVKGGLPHALKDSPHGTHVDQEQQRLLCPRGSGVLPLGVHPAPAPGQG